MLVLGIETSCDETGLAVYDSERGLLAHTLYSQVKLHAEYGGVVPELASRDHVRKIIPLLNLVLDEAGINKADLQGIAYTSGPGLMGALMVGGAMATALGYALDIPVLGVHHMEGHLLAPMLEKSLRSFPLSRCWCPAVTPSWSRLKPLVNMRCWVSHWTMPLAKPSTRPRKCSIWIILVALYWLLWQTVVRLTALIFLAR